MSTLKAFIFDLDGVITDSAEYHYLAWKTLADELGITFSRELNEELKGVSRMDSLEKILEFGNKETEFTNEEKEELAKKKNEHYVQLIKKISPADILPGIEELLIEIKSAGLGLGLASASKNASAVLESLNLKKNFDVIVDVNALKKGKPDPEIFLKAAELLNVQPDNCIGVEDAIAGVESIKSAGMFAVAIGPKNQFSTADIVYQTTAELSYNEITERFINR
ncbi:beta-phosphoglucomutase [Metabacillus litoralis]|uniref:Beta-phosphoglucomutase n=1 Tax=Metabacillus litoralis TaxID=152268 RepID=A0A5C6VWC5_9BACI|nr:beta-phosphoglucomutase [Metabacillus litoralis]TXC89836.1 beta-phosphoglucomutase [Metabacillus litoralis]